MKDFFSLIKFDSAHAKQGDVLISQPLLLDEYFHRSVILLADQSKKDGSVGFILNKKTNLNLSDITDDISFDDQIDIYFGGPVHTNHLFYVHTRPDLLPDARKINTHLYWGGDFEKLKYALSNRSISQDQICFFSGYAGWENKQLKDEIDQKSWIVSQIDDQAVFSKHKDTLWTSTLKTMGLKYQIMADFPESPTLN